MTNLTKEKVQEMFDAICVDVETLRSNLEAHIKAKNALKEMLDILEPVEKKSVPRSLWVWTNRRGLEWCIFDEMDKKPEGANRICNVGEWIPVSADSCPVPEGVNIRVKYKDGDVSSWARADQFTWGIDSKFDHSIIYYEVYNIKKE